MKKTLREFYPDVEEGSLMMWRKDYNSLLKSLDYEILLKCDEDDYTGDSLVLFKNDNQYGFLCFGWGSCSGCDELEACTTWEQLEELRETLDKDIIWRDSLQEIKDYIKSAEDLGNPYYIHNSIFTEFKQKLEGIK